MTRTQIFIALGTALLSFAGALLGVYTGSRLDQGNWETRFHLEQRKTIMERRVAIMERIAVSFSKAPIIAGLRESVKFDQASAALNVACVKLSMMPGRTTPACRQSTPMDLTHIESMAKELFALNAELNAAMVLAAIYFGPETKNAITALGSDPWVAGSATYQRLMDSMGLELRYFPE